MFTAAKARSKISSKKDIRKNIMKDIKKNIKEAIKNDETYCRLKYEINPDVQEELEKKGYIVFETKGDEYENYTIILFGRNQK